MNATRDHYESLLAKHYSRGMGGFEAKAAENAAFFEKHGLRPKASGNAVDLGAGSGFQAIPLARAGFSVTAVDFSPTLLAELTSRAGGLAVTAVQGDVLAVDELLSEQAGTVELVVCMGDTLAHLDSLDAARALFDKVRDVLEENGRFVLGFRDQSRELAGPDRFLPVFADDSLIFTCFLEYGPEHIDVTDLFNVRTSEGWTLEKSAYRKIRLTRDAVADMLGAAGFRLEHEESARGMVSIIAGKG